MQTLKLNNNRIWLLTAVLTALLLVAACNIPGIAPTTDDAAAPAGDTVPAPTDAAAAEPAATAAPEEDSSDGSPADRVGMYSSPPEMTIDTSKYYYATLKTEKGDIRVQLFADRAPVTVNNFVFLAREGYYDDTTFHRVLDGFMAQAGDPSGTGMGGPGYQFQDEIYTGGSFDRAGLLAMANAGPGTNGSQFFITFAPTTWLDGLHTIFGEVVEGAAVLDQLTRRDPQQGPDFDGDKILTIEIEETEASDLPTPTPLPPPTPTPTPYAPSSIAPEDLTAGARPLAELSMEERSGLFNTAPDMVIDTAKSYNATVSTSQGDIVISLNDELAPTTVNNFVVLASLGYYDGTPVNDASTDLVIFGAPENVPASYAGYYFSGELNGEAEWGPGAIGFLYAQDPATGALVSNGSQVLVAFEAPPAAAGTQISFFGEVVEGLDILSNLTLDDTIVSVTIQISE
ncbi:MAG: peptidylprolyl isomerase [Caldilineaceae bacterium]